MYGYSLYICNRYEVIFIFGVYPIHAYPMAKSRKQAKMQVGSTF